MSKTAGGGYVQVQLACKHFIRVRADIAVTLHSPFVDGSDFPCEYDGLQYAVARWGYEWHWSCRAHKVGGWWGQDERVCRDAAGKHRAKYGDACHIGIAYDKVTKDGQGTSFTWHDKYLARGGNRRRG
jgi:hypothetical protein